MQQFSQGDIVADRYQIDQLVGTGGFGIVYKARHLGLDMDVAVKALDLEGAALTDAEMPAFFARFKKEAKALTMLRHTGIVQVMDFGLLGDTTPFLVMDYFPGQQLLKWGEKAKPTTNQWLAVFRQIFEALKHAHELNVIHRDIKSQNVLVRGPADNPRVMLIDWGISYSVGGTRLTKVGELTGTPGSIDPELYDDDEKDFAPQSDFYAVGGLLYFALLNRDPFAADKLSAIARQRAIRGNYVVAPNEVDVTMSDGLNDFIMRLMSKRQSDRPSSASACVAIIDALLREEEIDLDAISAAHPYKMLVPERAPSPKGVETRNVVKGNEEQEIDDAAIADAVMADYERAKAQSLSVRSLSARPIDAAGPDEEAEQLPIDAGDLPPPVKVGTNKVNIKARAQKMGVAPSPSPISRRYLALAGVAVAAVLALVVVRGGMGTPKQTGEMAFAANPIKPEDLDTKRDDSALAKFAPQKEQASLTSFSPTIQAQYPTTIGGPLPPVPAPTAEKPSSRKHPSESPKEEKFDRSMKAVGLAGEDASPGQKEALSIPHNAEVSVKLLENLDTSSDEPVRVDLEQSLMVSNAPLLPIGSILWGRASLRYNRAQIRFDKATLPDGREFRIVAQAITQDGREGIDGGRIEFADPPKDKTGEKVLRAVGAVATDAISALPGGNALTRASQTVAREETRDLTQAERDSGRNKMRIIHARKTVFTVKFQRTGA